jgi:hypothetical protein
VLLMKDSKEVMDSILVEEMEGKENDFGQQNLSRGKSCCQGGTLLSVVRIVVVIWHCHEKSQQSFGSHRFVGIT